MHAEPTPLLSLIVLGYRNFERYTQACLNSLESSLSDAAIELIVIDNGSPDESAQRTREWCDKHPGVKCVISQENRGFAGGMNFGASQARGQWIALVNNDTVFPDNAIAAAKLVLLNAPETLGAIGPVTNAAGNGQRLWKPDADHAQWLEIGHWLNAHPTRLLMPTYRTDFFCVFIRKAAWDPLNGLDTGFGLGYYEDFDFSLRLRAAGWDQKISEDIFVLHAGSATFANNKDVKALLKRNKKLMVDKHAGVRFEHVRDGNLGVLQEYSKLAEQGVLNEGELGEALRYRLGLRYPALTGDAPRSFWKRMMWKRRVGGLSALLSGA